MNTITSRSHDKIKYAVRLQQKKYRNEYQQFIAEGVRTCMTLMTAGVELIDLFITEKNIAEIEDIIPEKHVTIVPDAVMDKLTSATTPSGFLGVFAIPKAPENPALTSGLVLTRIGDPGNMGTLIRTAAAMGLTNIILVEGTDPWSPKVVQGSAGTIGSVNILRWSWQELLDHKKDTPLYGLVVADGKEPETIDNKNILLVVGSEADGIPEGWLKDCNETITLPMPGDTESLNAAIAGAIALYLVFHT